MKSLLRYLGKIIRTYFFGPDGIRVGKIQGSILKKDILTDSQLNHHVHVVGASGFGKTVLLKKIIKDRINKGEGCLFLDLKSDRETIEEIKDSALKAGRESQFRIFSITDLGQSDSYNLLSGGNPTELRDRLMASFTWTEEYYKNQSSSFLLKLFVCLVWLRENKSLQVHIGNVSRAICNKDYLEELCLAIPESQMPEREIIEDLLQFSADTEKWNSIGGLRTQLESLTYSEFSPLISVNSPKIDLFQAVQKQEIIVVVLDTRRYGETARSIGRFILQDLKATTARIDSEIKKCDRIPFTVVIDEFADLAQEDFIAFADRARSSRFSIVTSHQEINDLKKVSPEFAARIMGNTATLYAFLQKGPESAELIAKTAGTKVATQETHQIARTLMFSYRTGNRSQRLVEEFIIHPNLIKSLKVGECICIKKYPISSAYKISVSLPV